MNAQIQQVAQQNGWAFADLTGVYPPPLSARARLLGRRPAHLCVPVRQFRLARRRVSQPGRPGRDRVAVATAIDAKYGFTIAIGASSPTGVTGRRVVSVAARRTPSRARPLRADRVRRLIYVTAPARSGFGRRQGLFVTRVGGYTSVVKITPPEPPQEDQIDADQAIIDRVLAGDRELFATLIARYSDPLYRHAVGMTGSPDDAADILQNSFIKAYQHLGEVRGRFDAWVFRIVANGCKDWLKNIRRTHLSYEEDDQPSGYETPEEELDRGELRGDLDEALDALPPSLARGVRDEARRRTVVRGDGRTARNIGRCPEDARPSRTRGAAETAGGAIPVMDNLDPRDAEREETPAPRKSRRARAAR